MDYADKEMVDEWVLRFIPWLVSDSQNAWIQSASISVYLRKTRRMSWDGSIKRCLDVANVNIAERSRGRGLFTSVLKCIEAEVLDRDYAAVYIDNVLTPRFAGFFLRKGYGILGPRHQNCFWKILNSAPISN